MTNKCIILSGKLNRLHTVVFRRSGAGKRVWEDIFIKYGFYKILPLQATSYGKILCKLVRKFRKKSFTEYNMFFVYILLGRFLNQHQGLTWYYKKWDVIPCILNRIQKRLKTIIDFCLIFIDRYRWGVFPFSNYAIFWYIHLKN